MVLHRSPQFADGAVATAPPQSEGAGFRPHHRCVTFVGATLCGMEWDEWAMVRALLGPHRRVLEMGARFGTTSCVIASVLNNSGRLVSVEPDQSVHHSLLANRDSHHCRFDVVAGTVGMDAAVSVLRVHPKLGGYGTLTSAASSSNKTVGPLVDNLPIAELERQAGYQFDTLLLDCEGCIQNVLGHAEGVAFLERLDLLLIEEDATPATPCASKATISRLGTRRA